MRTIQKGTEPASLTQHRLTPSANYDNYAGKDELRRRLVSEQRGLCCYCLSRIHSKAGLMKIEHWHCQDRYRDEQMDYRNLLASCSGSEGQPRRMQDCDSHKGNSDLSRHPANHAHPIEQLIRYKEDGTITSSDATFDGDLDRTLNLNQPFLKNNRKAALDAFKTTLQKRGNLEKLTLRLWLKQCNGESSPGDLEPYCQVIVYWLRKRLAVA